MSLQKCSRSVSGGYSRLPYLIHHLELHSLEHITRDICLSAIYSSSASRLKEVLVGGAKGGGYRRPLIGGLNTQVTSQNADGI
jgi:hypothetical protein